MSILPRLLELRPYAYHTCGATNFESIQGLRALVSARDLLTGTPHIHLLRKRRPASALVTLASGKVEIRDNLPLRLGSVSLEPGCTLEEFLFLLNSRVFLWPGTAAGMSAAGESHFEHYQGTGVVRVIRVSLASLLAANHDRGLQVTYCNSGSARHQQGKPVTRGPSTFHPIAEAGGPASKVKEITFVGSARLPADAVWSHSPRGPWSPM